MDNISVEDNSPLIILNKCHLNYRDGLPIEDDSDFTYMKHVLRKTYYLLSQQNNVAVIAGILIGFLFGCYLQDAKRFVRNQVWWAGTRLAASHYGAKAGGFVYMCHAFLNCSEFEAGNKEEKDTGVLTNGPRWSNGHVKKEEDDDSISSKSKHRGDNANNKNDDDGIDREALGKEDQRESGVDPENVPKHVAVIMDGNRRFGKAKFGNATQVCYRVDIRMLVLHVCSFGDIIL